MSDPEDDGLAERPQERATRPGPTPQTAATQAEPPTFGPGTLLAGRFRIVRFVARGGMGEVYEEEDLELNERVALKTIRHELASEPRALDRFKTEIHLARKVTHPNVCRIYDVFREPGQGGVGETIFLTMELLRGQTLAEHLERERRLGLPEALPLVRQVAQALWAARRAGVIHRDFKSSNVVPWRSIAGQRTRAGAARSRSPQGESELGAEGVVVAESGDLGYAYGRGRSTGAGPVDAGELAYLNIWQRRGGKWRLIVHVSNAVRASEGAGPVKPSE